MSSVTTLFVVGFPEDVTAREMLNLCRLCKGFKFATVSCAKRALQQLHGMAYDETDPNSSELRAEFARRDAGRQGLGGEPVRQVPVQPQPQPPVRQAPEPPWQ